jgi:hypothetical protein
MLEYPSHHAQKLAAVVLGGAIYTSTDSGVTWEERTAAGSRNWQSIASSADGTVRECRPLHNVHQATVLVPSCGNKLSRVSI